MENFASLFEKHASNIEVREGEVINAQVVEIDSKYVKVSAGLKSDSFIPIAEFKDSNGTVEVKVGDTTYVAIELIEDGYGETRLSREKAKKIVSWNELESALEKQEILSGLVYGRVKGGLGVLYKNIRLFLPGSLLDVRAVRDFTPYEGKDVEFKVIKVDRRRNNIVISRKAVIAERTGDDHKAYLDKVQEGNVVKGVIKNITDYGAFVDLGGFDGLLYITDLSWKRIRHPSEILTIGQEIEAKVLRFDQEKQRISLGLKQLSNDPWDGIAERYPEQTRLYGKVSNITDYGAFIEIDNGIEGLVHISEMDWTNKNVNPAKLVNLGDEIQVQILEINYDKRRISLGMKQCKPNPWIEFANSFKKGDKLTGVIRSITDFGLFIGLNGGIDGLVHISDISWSLNSEQAIRQYTKGQEVEAVILSIDVEKERIALGIKQLENDTYELFCATHEVGGLVKATVKEVNATQAVVDLKDGVEAILPAHQFSADKVDDLSAVLHVNDEIEVLITALDKKARSISISIKAKDTLNATSALKRIKNEVKDSGTTNLGALLQDKFNQ